MGTEIERKFLVRGNEWRTGEGATFRQGYLSTDHQRTVRVRIADKIALLTVKGETHGTTRAEYEYPIPLQDALEMLEDLCVRPLIEKRRYEVEHGGLMWELDEFFNDNDGLILAEVELASEDQEIAIPPWIGREVTGDPRYYNSNLVQSPYSTW